MDVPGPWPTAGRLAEGGVRPRPVAGVRRDAGSAPERVSGALAVPFPGRVPARCCAAAQCRGRVHGRHGRNRPRKGRAKGFGRAGAPPSASEDLPAPPAGRFCSVHARRLVITPCVTPGFAHPQRPLGGAPRNTFCGLVFALCPGRNSRIILCCSIRNTCSRAWPTAPEPGSARSSSLSAAHGPPVPPVRTRSAAGRPDRCSSRPCRLTSAAAVDESRIPRPFPRRSSRSPS